MNEKGKSSNSDGDHWQFRLGYLQGMGIAQFFKGFFRIFKGFLDYNKLS